MDKTDWSDLNKIADISDEESKRLNSPSGRKCPVCTKEMTTGDNEAAGICSRCYEEENLEQKLR
ncbi:hypothetical protein LCGC14_0140560 [marine sediment metagenome]|uniref:Uncharacterized protein n=1 Tax=marine sediment metagenome TaxID=412755 RepID=A0A0F9V0S3_9ZZZZ